MLLVALLEQLSIPPRQRRAVTLRHVLRLLADTLCLLADTLYLMPDTSRTARFHLEKHAC